VGPAPFRCMRRTYNSLTIHPPAASLFGGERRTITAYRQKAFGCTGCATSPPRHAFAAHYPRYTHTARRAHDASGLQRTIMVVTALAPCQQTSMTCGHMGRYGLPGLLNTCARTTAATVPCWTCPFSNCHAVLLVSVLALSSCLSRPLCRRDGHALPFAHYLLSHSVSRHAFLRYRPLRTTPRPRVARFLPTPPPPPPPPPPPTPPPHPLPHRAPAHHSAWHAGPRLHTTMAPHALQPRHAFRRTYYLGLSGGEQDRQDRTDKT